MNYNNNFIFNENLTNKEIYLTCNNNNYSLGFEYYFKYLNNEEKEFLEKLFDFSLKINDGYVNNIVWYTFMVTSQIELAPIKEKYIFNNLNNNIEFSIQKNGRNINTYLTTDYFKNNNIYKNNKKQKTLFNNNITTTNNDNDIILQKIIYYNDNNKIDFLINFLHCVFSTKSKHYLKKCKKCNKYFITNEPSKYYCNRTLLINNKKYTCADKAKQLKKRPKYTNLNTRYNILRYKFNNNKIYTNEYVNTFENDYNNNLDKYIETGNIKFLEDVINKYENSI